MLQVLSTASLISIGFGRYGNTKEKSKWKITPNKPAKRGRPRVRTWPPPHHRPYGSVARRFQSVMTTCPGRRGPNLNKLSFSARLPCSFLAPPVGFIAVEGSRGRTAESVRSFVGWFLPFLTESSGSFPASGKASGSGYIFSRWRAFVGVPFLDLTRRRERRWLHYPQSKRQRRQARKGTQPFGHSPF